MPDYPLYVKMVKYKFLDKQGEWFRYKYYPENKENWGIVSVNVISMQSTIDTLAENDSINCVQVAENKFVSVSSYAGHVIHDILSKCQGNEIPQDGIVVWY